MKMQDKEWFDQYGWLHELRFYIPAALHQRARDYLAEFGAWDNAELDHWMETEDTEHELALRVLWLFCGDIREGQGDCLYLGH